MLERLIRGRSLAGKASACQVGDRGSKPRRPLTMKRVGAVQREMWNPGDYYHTVKVQVDPNSKEPQLKDGDRVMVTIRKMSYEEFQRWMNR